MGLSSKQVSSDRNGWNQALLEGAGTLEFPKTSPMKKQQQQSEQQQQQQPEQLKCPRCDSANTKFCYYNNYNKSQPRHFCKACKRHWTKGGTLRNVPVGGGRKNKRPKTSKTASKTNNTSSTTTKTTTSTTYSGMRTNNNNNNMGIHAQQLRVSPPLGGALTLNSGVGVEDKTFSEAFYQNFLIKQHHQLPQSSITFNGKGLSDHYHQGVFLGSNPTTNLGLSSQYQHDHDQEMQFPYSSFESNPCSISSTITSIQSPNVYNFTGSDHANNSSSLSDQHQPSWAAMHTTTSSTRNNTNNNINNDNNDHNDHNNSNNNNLMEMSSNWGWDDFDKFVSVEADLSMPWDDADIN